jgi:HlyD family secretion protein
LWSRRLAFVVVIVARGWFDQAMRAIGALLVLAALCAGGWYGYRTWLRPPEDAKFRTVEVRRGAVVSTVSATGAVEPLVKVLVGSQVSGTVTKWYADFNDRVTVGFVLAELDQDRFKAQLEQRRAAALVARARVEESRARVTTATLERRRVESARTRDAASEFELDTAKAAEEAAVAALHAAEAQLAAAEADARLASIELEKTIIRSPIDGVVISRDVDAGQTVAASLSAPTLFTIANDLTKMRVNANVSETDIGKVREAMPVEFRVDAFPGRVFRGVVAQVRYAETVVDNVVTYTTLIDVDNSDLALRPGMTATIVFEVAKTADVLIVPNAALRFDPSAARANEGGWGRPARATPMKPRVFRLNGAELDEISVELGLNDGAFTAITSDELKEGDRVVVEQSAPPGGGGQRPVPQRTPRM